MWGTSSTCLEQNCMFLLYHLQLTRVAESIVIRDSLPNQSTHYHHHHHHHHHHHRNNIHHHHHHHHHHHSRSSSLGPSFLKNTRWKPQWPQLQDPKNDPRGKSWCFMSPCQSMSRFLLRIQALPSRSPGFSLDQPKVSGILLLNPTWTSVPASLVPHVWGIFLS